MMKEFETIDLEFFGIQVKKGKGEIFLSQGKYIQDLLKNFHMAKGKPVATPMVQT